MYIRKTKDVYYLQGFYCGAWEDLFECENRADAREQKKTYDDNEKNVAHRIVKRREAINNG